MIELFWDAPFWVHCIITAITLVVVGVLAVDNKGKLDGDAIGAGIVLTLLVVCFWQAIVILAGVAAVLYVPFEIGVLIKKSYLKYQEIQKEKEKQQKRRNHFTSEGKIDYLGASIMEENSKMLKDKKYSELC